MKHLKDFIFLAMLAGLLVAAVGPREAIVAVPTSISAATLDSATTSPSTRAAQVASLVC